LFGRPVLPEASDQPTFEDQDRNLSHLSRNELELDDELFRQLLPDVSRPCSTAMLLVLKIPLPAVMNIMGWSDASITKRYMHVPRGVVTAIAAEVGALMWDKATDRSVD
jgi:hypothetical protein